MSSDQVKYLNLGKDQIIRTHALPRHASLDELLIYLVNAFEINYLYLARNEVNYLLIPGQETS